VSPPVGCYIHIHYRRLLLLLTATADTQLMSMHYARSMVVYTSERGIIVMTLVNLLLRQDSLVYLRQWPLYGRGGSV